jgi:hypothetical protein
METSVAKMKCCKIYHLEIDGEPFYVGKTDRPLKRLQEHRSKFNNKHIEMVELEETDDWKEAEQYWIQHYRNLGYQIVNKCKGGNGRPSIPQSGETVLNQVIRECYKVFKYLSFHLDINISRSELEQYFNTNGYLKTYNKLWFDIIPPVFREYYGDNKTIKTNILKNYGIRK